MFARSLAKNLIVAPKRTFATATKGVFKAKTAKEVWLGDAGAYPVMGVIAFAVIFSTGTGLYFMATTPDARLNKGDRKTIFRGAVSTHDE